MNTKDKKRNENRTWEMPNKIFYYKIKTAYCSPFQVFAIFVAIINTKHKRLLWEQLSASVS